MATHRAKEWSRGSHSMAVKMRSTQTTMELLLLLPGENERVKRGILGDGSWYYVVLSGPVRGEMQQPINIED